MTNHVSFDLNDSCHRPIRMSQVNTNVSTNDCQQWDPLLFRLLILVRVRFYQFAERGRAVASCSRISLSSGSSDLRSQHRPGVKRLSVQAIREPTSIIPRCLRPDSTPGHNVKRTPVFQAHAVSFSFPVLFWIRFCQSAERVGRRNRSSRLIPLDDLIVELTDCPSEAEAIEVSP